MFVAKLFLSGTGKRLRVDVIYTELSKGFDKVSNSILLQKLKSFVVCNNLMQLLKSIVMGKYQFVEYNGYISTLFNVESGVAQSSNLGPLKFIIYFNDVVTCIKSHIFADELKIAKMIKTDLDCFDLQSVNENIVL